MVGIDLLPEASVNDDSSHFKDSYLAFIKD